MEEPVEGSFLARLTQPKQNRSKIDAASRLGGKASLKRSKTSGHGDGAATTKKSASQAATFGRTKKKPRKGRSKRIKAGSTRSEDGRQNENKRPALFFFPT